MIPSERPKDCSHRRGWPIIGGFNVYSRPRHNIITKELYTRMKRTLVLVLYAWIRLGVAQTTIPSCAVCHPFSILQSQMSHLKQILQFQRTAENKELIYQYRVLVSSLPSALSPARQAPLPPTPVPAVPPPPLSPVSALPASSRIATTPTNSPPLLSEKIFALHGV